MGKTIDERFIQGEIELLLTMQWVDNVRPGRVIICSDSS